jgi:hypothetical protein
MPNGFRYLDIVFDYQDEVGGFGQGAIVWHWARACPTKLGECSWFGTP